MCKPNMSNKNIFTAKLSPDRDPKFQVQTTRTHFFCTLHLAGRRARKKHAVASRRVVACAQICLHDAGNWMRFPMLVPRLHTLRSRKQP